jgi:feruloyl esterase
VKQNTLLAVILAAAPAFAASCESLASLALPDTTITSAQAVAAGAFTLPARPGGKGDASQAFKDLPAFCRVEATLKPSSDSEIKVEVWLPSSGWNGKFQSVGNGGWAGVISYAALGEGIRRGYATASTDTGHTGANGQFALGHPEKLIDFAYRSEHEMTVKGKALTEAFYGNAPKHSYWNGCSTGGRQGLKEATRFPNDFDGIIAGAPANPRTHLAVQAIWLAHATLKDPASYIPKEKYPLIHKAVLDACDAMDGVKDGVLDDPTRCRFDPKVLECKGADGPACLTTPQVEAARKIYSPAKNPRTGEEIFPGFVPGTELGWALKTGGPEPELNAFDHLKYVVFRDPHWDWRTFDFDKDVALADQIDNGTVNVNEANLKPFLGHGKLLMYHGFADPNVTPLTTIKYYKSVVDTLGGTKKTMDSMRLFMAPGMGHCRGGDGPDTFDVVSAMEQWVEKGKAPEQLIATHKTNGVADRTRPLCPYPQVARYKGSGSTDDAANFTCKAP